MTKGLSVCLLRILEVTRVRLITLLGAGADAERAGAVCAVDSLWCAVYLILLVRCVLHSLHIAWHGQYTSRLSSAMP